MSQSWELLLLLFLLTNSKSYIIPLLYNIILLRSVLTISCILIEDGTIWVKETSCESTRRIHHITINSNTLPPYILMVGNLFSNIKITTDERITKHKLHGWNELFIKLDNLKWMIHFSTILPSNFFGPIHNIIINNSWLNLIIWDEDYKSIHWSLR
jgi:hypothetical protein